MADYCERCELPLDQCAHSPAALAASAQEKIAESDTPRTIASLSSECSRCGYDIEPGDEIVMSHGVWVCGHHVSRTDGPPETDGSIFEGM